MSLPLLPTIEQLYPNYHLLKWGPEHRAWVSTSKVVGTAGPNAYRFYYNWTPTREGRDPRWWSIYKYVRDHGRTFPPDLVEHNHIHLLKINGEYYAVGDGNRRISIAHIFGIPRVYADISEGRP